MKRTIKDLSDIFLRRREESDRPSVIRILNDERVWINMMDSAPYQFDETKAKARIQYINHKSNYIKYAIDLNGEAIGAVGINFLDGVYEHIARIDYRIDPTARGQGIASHAVQYLELLIQGDYPHILKLEANVFSRNPVSRDLLLRLGYTLESVSPKRIYKQGEFADEYILSKWIHTPME